MTHKALFILCGLAVMSSIAFADDSFESIAGFSLGQDCTGSKFTKKKSYVRNPDDVTDRIDVSRNQHESNVAGGHSLKVSCSIIDNKTHQITLTSKDPAAIADIKESLHEKMGRSPDDKESVNSAPRRIGGNTMDGHKIESEHWNISGNRKARAFTVITQPYGSNALSDLDWLGGIELSYLDITIAEWRHLKQFGKISPNQKEALEEKRRKDSIKGLLD